MRKSFILIAIILLFSTVSAEQGDFTIVVLPDTQKYSRDFPEIFNSQTEWIAENAESMNIVFVSHLGDIVDDYDSVEQWQNAGTSMGFLDGKVAYGIAPGNHDFSREGDISNFNFYFPPSRFNSHSWYGGNFPFGSNENSFQLFSASGLDFIVLHLRYCPGKAALQWANQVLRTHSDRLAIISTHAYLGLNGEREVHSYKESGCGTGSNNTEYIWDELIYPNENVFLVLCGHVHGEAGRVDPNIAGKPVLQVLSDYQSLENGGNGFLRIMRFSPTQRKISVQTYSPSLNQFELDNDSQFSLEFSPGPKPEPNPFPVELAAGIAAIAAAGFAAAFLKKTGKI
ncbi:MAG: metallophosphoesterase [Candidatus Diapherotrites archaeon]|uniref:Metallophosphoesterase n=1 Tax=Candidatus Iainarchaeum sp. TaxID=3101447 RepID=A0A939C8P7_9ARCH|nr:metallophosphoesterase [Candidatus Diapherotrites archaeon]